MNTTSTVLIAAMMALSFSRSVFANIPHDRIGAWTERSEESLEAPEIDRDADRDIDRDIDRDDERVMIFSSRDGNYEFERSGR